MELGLEVVLVISGYVVVLLRFLVFPPCVVQHGGNMKNERILSSLNLVLGDFILGAVLVLQAKPLLCMLLRIIIGSSKKKNNRPTTH